MQNDQLSLSKRTKILIPRNLTTSKLDLRFRKTSSEFHTQKKESTNSERLTDCTKDNLMKSNLTHDKLRHTTDGSMYKRQLHKKNKSDFPKKEFLGLKIYNEAGVITNKDVFDNFENDGFSKNKGGAGTKSKQEDCKQYIYNNIVHEESIKKVLGNHNPKSSRPGKTQLFLMKNHKTIANKGHLDIVLIDKNSKKILENPLSQLTNSEQVGQSDSHHLDIEKAHNNLLNTSINDDNHNNSKEDNDDLKIFKSIVNNNPVLVKDYETTRKILSKNDTFKNFDLLKNKKKFFAESPNQEANTERPKSSKNIDVNIMGLNPQKDLPDTENITLNKKFFAQKLKSQNINGIVSPQDSQNTNTERNNETSPINCSQRLSKGKTARVANNEMSDTKKLEMSVTPSHNQKVVKMLTPSSSMNILVEKESRQVERLKSIEKLNDYDKIAYTRPPKNERGKVWCIVNNEERSNHSRKISNENILSMTKFGTKNRESATKNRDSVTKNRDSVTKYLPLSEAQTMRSIFCLPGGLTVRNKTSIACEVDQKEKGYVKEENAYDSLGKKIEIKEVSKSQEEDFSRQSYQLYPEKKSSRPSNIIENQKSLINIELHLPKIPEDEICLKEYNIEREKTQISLKEQAKQITEVIHDQRAIMKDSILPYNYLVKYIGDESLILLLFFDRQYRLDKNLTEDFIVKVLDSEYSFPVTPIKTIKRFPMTYDGFCKRVLLDGEKDKGDMKHQQDRRKNQWCNDVKHSTYFQNFKLLPYVIGLLKKLIKKNIAKKMQELMKDFDYRFESVEDTLNNHDDVALDAKGYWELDKKTGESCMSNYQKLSNKSKNQFKNKKTHGVFQQIKSNQLERDLGIDFQTIKPEDEKSNIELKDLEQKINKMIGKARLHSGLFYYNEEVYDKLIKANMD